MSEHISNQTFSEAMTKAEVKAIYERRRKMLDEEFRTSYYKYCKQVTEARRFYQSAEKDIKHKILELEHRLITEREKRDNIIMDAEHTFSVRKLAANNAMADLNTQRSIRYMMLEVADMLSKEGGEA